MDMHIRVFVGHTAAFVTGILGLYTNPVQYAGLTPACFPKCHSIRTTSYGGLTYHTPSMILSASLYFN